MADDMQRDPIQFVTDEEGNRSSVIISIELFENMLDTIEELEAHYFAHHPEDRKKMDIEFGRFADLEKVLEEQ